MSNNQTQQKGEKRTHPTDDEAVDGVKRRTQFTSTYQDLLKRQEEFFQQLEVSRNVAEENEIFWKNKHDSLLAEKNQLSDQFRKQNIDFALLKGQKKTADEELSTSMQKEKDLKVVVDYLNVEVQQLQMEKEGLQTIVKEKDNEIEKVKGDLDKLTNDYNSITQHFGKFCEDLKKKRN